MEDYKRAFIEYALEQEVLQFGEFVLKSGRSSPYFFNAGRFNTGEALGKLGGFYASALMASGLKFSGLFGPAYKGIPLATVTAVSLSSSHKRDVDVTFNRKELKDHGEGGELIGAPLQGEIVVIDDVITAGTAIREVLELISRSPAKVVGAVVAIDRQERGKGSSSAISELEKEHGLSVVSVVCLTDVVEFLVETGKFEAYLGKIQEYQREYGV